MGPSSTSVIQVTNIAPTVTNEQLRTLLAFVGTIREFVVYPTNDPAQQISRVCYVKYIDPMSVCVAQHLTNTVFIDRAIFVKPISDGKIPDESMALKLANEGHSQNSSNSGVVSQIANVNGIQSITTIDPRLNALGLPQYPPLPANLDPSKIEEIRRTISISNISQFTSAEALLEFFNQFGEVKYLRMTSKENDIIKSALIEFTDQSSVANALQNTGVTLNGSQLSISHSTTNILKPQYKTIDNDKFHDSRDLKKRNDRDRSRSPSYRRSRSPVRRRSRSPHRTRERRRSESRSPVRERRRRSRSRERRRSVERKRSRSRSYSKDSRSRDRNKRNRSKERDRRHSRDRSLERRHDRDRRKDRDRNRDRRSPDKEREKSKDRDRSRRRERERSRDLERKERHRSKKDKERRRSRSRSKSKTETKLANEKETKLDFEFEHLSKEDIVTDGDKKIIEAESPNLKNEEKTIRKSPSPQISGRTKSSKRKDKKTELGVESEDDQS